MGAERGLDDGTVLELADLDMVEFWRSSGRRSAGAEVVESGGLVLVAGATEHAVAANVAVRTRPGAAGASPVDGEVLARAGEFFASRDRGFTLVCRVPREESLVEAATAEGFHALDVSPWMVVDAPLPGPDAGRLGPDVEIHRVRTEGEVAAFASVMARSYATYGMPEDAALAAFTPELWLSPDVLMFLARLDGEPVGGALCCLTHGIGGVYWVGTVEEARGRGIGEAATAVASNAGFEAGARLVSLQASPMGAPIYRRMGFREIGGHRWVVRFAS